MMKCICHLLWILWSFQPSRCIKGEYNVSEIKPFSWGSRCAFVRHPWQSDAGVGSPSGFCPSSCCQCWPSGQLREPGSFCVARTQKSGRQLTQPNVRCVACASPRVGALTCTLLPLSLRSWSFLRVGCPHRPARNTGSPLRAEGRTPVKNKDAGNEDF